MGLEASDWHYSLRQVAERAGIAATYLSKIEREKLPPPSEDIILKLAVELHEDPVELLARGGKVPSDVLEIIRVHPRAFVAHIRELRGRPAEEIVRMTTQVRDGKW
jgi:HTH-type transcriptional regulator, competence development regulator